MQEGTAPERPGRTTVVSGIVAAAWSLGFAAVSVGQLVSGPAEGTRYAAYADGLAVMIAAVLVLKLVGAALALAAITPGRWGLPLRPVALGLWGAFGVLAIGFHRLFRLRWTVAMAGLVGSPLLLAFVLGVGPGILGALGLVPG